MHTPLRHLYGQTLQALRGERSLQDVAQRGEISPTTWRRWESGRQLPQPSQVRKILLGLGCTELQFRLAFLARARSELERLKADQLKRKADSRPEIADLVRSFEKAMTLQQKTIEAYESLAASLNLMLRLTDTPPLELAERRDG